MAGRTEGTVRDVVGETSGVDRCPAPEASPVLQSEEGDCIILFEVDEKIGLVYHKSGTEKRSLRGPFSAVRTSLQVVLVMVPWQGTLVLLTTRPGQGHVRAA